MTPDTIQQTLPPASIGTAIDGGLGYHDLFDRNAYTYVEVGPLMKAQLNDTVTVLWAGSALVLHSVTEKDLELGTFPIAVSNGKIADAGDGDKVLSYTVTYTQGGGEEYSQPVLIKVKRSVPGGLDPSPGTPDFNENLTPATVAPNPVPPDADSVTVHAPLWLNPAIGDVMVVSWNGATFLAPHLTEPFPEVISVTLTATQVLDAGVGPAVPVTWGVHDVVANWSGWAKETSVEVRLEDPGRFLAPRVGDKDHPWTEVDLAGLGSADLPVFVPDYDGATEGDTVVVHATGMNLGGRDDRFDSQPQSMGEPAFGLTFALPIATAAALVGGNLRVWYDVQRGAGTPSPSHSVWLRVLGEAAGKPPAPIVAEATDTDGDGLADRLDPDKANPAHVTIDYPGMALYDSVTLILEGTAGDGAPVRFQTERQINTIAPLSLAVPQIEILRFLGGDMDVYYQVVPFSRRSRASIRALRYQESTRLSLSVRRDSAEQPLPAPTVKDDKGSLVENGGFLDPASTEAVLQTPLYDRIAKGDEITYRWIGTGSTRTRTYKVADPTKPPADYADRDFIVENIGGNMVVSYSVRRLGANPVVPSETLNFSIAVRERYIDFTAMEHGYIFAGTTFTVEGLAIKALPSAKGLVYLGLTPKYSTRGLNVGYEGSNYHLGASVELTPDAPCREVTIALALGVDCYVMFYRGTVKLHEELVDAHIQDKVVNFLHPEGISHIVVDSGVHWSNVKSIKLVAR